jgi:hypothetical protein
MNLYTDYLISSRTYTTLTGMTSFLSIKHDKITQHLLKVFFKIKFLWLYSPLYIKNLKQNKAVVVLSFDDSLKEKQYIQSNKSVWWHNGSMFKRAPEEFNFLTNYKKTTETNRFAVKHKIYLAASKEV